MTFNFQIDDGQHALDPEQQLQFIRGYQVINAAGGSNLLSAGSGDFDVDAASGDINFGGSTISCTAQTVNLSGEVDPNLPRKVTVYRDANGDLAYQAGTAQAANPTGATRRNASEPAPPTLFNTDAVVLGTVWVGAGATSITSADIRDRRLPAELNVESLGRDLDAQGNDITGVGELSTDDINIDFDGWVDVSGNRSFGTTETNNTDQVREVRVRIAVEEDIGATNSSKIGTMNFNFTVNGYQVDQLFVQEIELHTDSSGTSVDYLFTLAGIVGAGQTYRINANENDFASESIASWIERNW